MMTDALIDYPAQKLELVSKQHRGFTHLKTPDTLLGPDFIELDDSDTSDDDSSSLSSQDSDETLVSPRALVIPAEGSEESLDFTNLRIPITLTSPPERPERSHLPSQKPSLPPRSAPADYNWQRPLPQNQHVSNPCFPGESLIPVRKGSLEYSVTPRKPRSSSLCLRHDAALRSYQVKQEESQIKEEEDERHSAEKADVIGFTSYPRCKKPQPLNTEMLQRFMKGIVIAYDDDSDETDSDGSSDSSDDASDERKQASLRLFRTLESAQSRSFVGSPGSPKQLRRPPSLDQISSKTSQEAAMLGIGSPVSAFGTHARSVSCPSPTIANHQFGCVEVFVTPPTPRPADHSDFVPGVVLRPSGAPSVLSSHEEQKGHLAAPFFDVAPGRQRLLEERQLPIRAQWLAQRRVLLNFGPGSPVPSKANQLIAAASFSPSEQRSNGKDTFYSPNTPKYVAPGRRGYGQAGKGHPSLPVRRHGLATGSQTSWQSRVSTPRSSAFKKFQQTAGNKRHSLESGLSREAAGRSMLAKLERRRNSVDVLA